MKRIIAIWKKDTRGKIVVIIGSIISFCLTCTVAVMALPSPDTPTKTPITAEEIFTQAASTIVAELTQTAAPSATLLILETPTLYISPTAEQTATFLPLPTPTIEKAEGVACIPDTPPQTGTVLEVIDGDTIRVILEDGLAYSIRYIGMDTPEDTSTVEYFGSQATQKNRELLSSGKVLLIKDVSETDRYGRLLRYVIADGVFVNYVLVAEGFANVASYPPDTSCIETFRSAENQASSALLGLWGAPPTSPAPLPTSVSSGGGGGNVVCSCGGNIYNCTDFGTHASAQACYNYCVSLGSGDIHKLDRDNDGQACESLP